MSGQQRTLRIVEAANESGSHPLMKQLASRESQELVVGFAGPLGCGIDSVRGCVQKALVAAGYQVLIIKLSEEIEPAIKKHGLEIGRGDGGSELANRYRRLQAGGNALRDHFSDEILGAYAIAGITALREKSKAHGESASSEADVPSRRAYLIDQLKHEAEVDLLRTVYRNLFFLVGVLSVEGRRKGRLTEKGMSESEAAAAMEKDRNEPNPHGQHLDKTLERADFFIRNDRPNVDETMQQVTRFIDLMHGVHGRSPTRDEFGMYTAFASKLASSCLSRQVGAAIIDPEGNVIGTGCNDVPRAGGGLYRGNGDAGDARCVKLEGGKCFNDYHKKVRENRIRRALMSEDAITADVIEKVLPAVVEASGLRDLIEFSRAVHAEMEAIISVARRGGQSTQGTTLLTTTFPCHSCARHIVAAGITRVVYIEPYERSLALQLHGDAIVLETLSPGGNRVSAVEFLHFEGVAPRRYVDMFLPRGARKTDGVAVHVPLAVSARVSPEYLDDYRQFELQVVKRWSEATGFSEPAGGAEGSVS